MISEDRRMAFKVRHSINNLMGWLVAVLATFVYMLTLEPTVSFWDCGEFIATSYKFQIGHPPGAPMYQLLAHCFTLFAGDNPERIAWWSNALSAVAGGLTAMFLFWTLVRLIASLGALSSQEQNHRFRLFFASFVGTACYVFCDTAWFSAVESEVYSLSMLFSSAIVWSIVRWYQSDDYNAETRWLFLIALLLGMSVGVHQLSLLTVPAFVLVYIFKRCRSSVKLGFCFRNLAFCLLFFIIGLTPYLIIPIRANVNPPVNQGDPSTWKSFKAYVTREQYEHAPLLYGRCFNSPIVGYEDGKPVYAKEMDMFFPRMWKHGPHAEQYYTDWCGRHGKMVDVNGEQYYKPSFGDNLVFFVSYQVYYMYLRYLMWNFSGRYNDSQGFGNMMKGQFITGIPFVDRLYVGNGSSLPDSLPGAGHNRYFLLPFILGLIGIIAHSKFDKKGFWIVMTLFLMSSIALSVYLNHPAYEPRERDYAYVLSFYAFAIWIGVGAFRMLGIGTQKSEDNQQKFVTKSVRPLMVAFLLFVPALMAFQNWDDHDRSGRYVALDSARNLLRSCDKNAILFTLGDNDTFPLWYLQQVEGVRTDVHIVNLSLLGSESYARSCKQQFVRQGRDLMPDDGWRQGGPYSRMKMIVDNNAGERPVFFSHYAYDVRKNNFPGALQLCGIAYKLMPPSQDSVDVADSYRLFKDSLQWHPVEQVYIDETSRGFMCQYWRDVLLVVENLLSDGMREKAEELLDRACSYLPLDVVKNLQIMYAASKAYKSAGANGKAERIRLQLQKDLKEQLDYYQSMKPSMQYYIPYIIEPLLQLQKEIMSND